MFRARKKKKGERIFELSEESRPRLSSDPLPMKSDAFPQDELEFEVSFLEGVLEKDPYHQDTLVVLGNAYTRLGRYEDGLRIDERIVKILPDDPTAFYNLACSFSLLGDRDRAIDALAKSVEKGYADVDHLLQDPDLAAVREDPRFAAVVKGITQR